MKKLYSLALLLVLSSVAMAQHWRLSSFALERYDATSNDFEPADSAKYFYSGNRTGEPSFQWLESILRSKDYRTVLYDINPELQYDSVQTYRGNSQGGYSDPKLGYTQFFNNTLITGRDRMSSGNITTQEKYTYNTNGLLQESEAKQLKSTYYYNSNNTPDSIVQYIYDMSFQQYILYKTWHFTYDANKSLMHEVRKEIIYNTQYFSDYTYNAAGLPEYILVTANDFQSPPVGDTFYTYAYTYDAAGDLKTEIKQVSDGPNGIGGNTVNYDRHLHTYDGGHNRVKDLTENWNSTTKQWDAFSQWKYTYTAAGLPETFESLRWNTVNPNWDPMMDTNDVRTSHRMKLNYEIVWPVGIATQPTNPATLRLYPNPAVGIITLRLEMEKATPFTAAIQDMQGRVLMQWSEAGTKQYTRTLPLAAMPAGNYVLKVTGDGLEKAQMFNIQ